VCVNFNGSKERFMHTAKINLNRPRGAFGTNVSEAPLERSQLIFAEIEGFDSIHKVPSRKNLMLLANQIKEIFIVIQ
jgi:hypothetical protein